jgi:hypothetical protein
MSENIERNRGRPQSYKFDRGGTPTEFGPYIGKVKNNTDDTRTGTLKVYIKEFAGPNEDDEKLWKTVRYVPPFYGYTPRNNTTGSGGAGSYTGNQNSYGMWFVPPDLGIEVMCFFVGGDPDKGYWVGCVPQNGVTQMLPAIGAVKNFKTQTNEQKTLTSGAQAKQLPVVELNNENNTLKDNPRFWTLEKPVHSYVFAVLANQGLLGDTIRGPITSSAQRETPSSSYGIITPGRPIYQGGLTEEDVRKKVQSGQTSLADIKIEGRRGGHSIVLDDGDLEGFDNLIRIRTAKGHQITMSDDGDCFYIIHANGQTWIEMGTEGTVDVYSTNSVNVRTQGTLNLHSDKEININAGELLNIRAKNLQIESEKNTSFSAGGPFLIYGQKSISLFSDQLLGLKCLRGSWDAGVQLGLKAVRIDLNGPFNADLVAAPPPITKFSLDDVKFSPSQGWIKGSDKIDTICSRAPTHEPYPYHNKGVQQQTSILSGGGSTFPAPDAAGALLSAAGTSVPSPVNVGQILKQTKASAIGKLSVGDVTALTAQAKASVSQAADVIDVAKGIGEYGFQPAQLEVAGLIKPGTINTLAQQIQINPPFPTQADNEESEKLVAQGIDITPDFVAQSKKLTDALRSPTVWTGKDGVSNLDNFLQNPTLQTLTQQTLMEKSYTGLQTAGIVLGTETPSVLGSLLQPATKYGVGSVATWIESTSTGLGNNLSSITGNFGNLGGVNAGINNLAGSVTGGINQTLDNISRDLSNTVSNALGGSGSNPLNNLVGGASGGLQIQLNSANLGSQLSSLSGQLSGKFSNLGATAGGQLNNLAGQFSGQATNLVNNMQGQLANFQGQIASIGNSLKSLAQPGGLQALGQGALNQGMAQLAQSAQFAIGMIGSKLGGFSAFVRSSTPASDTVARAAVDNAVKEALGNIKIPQIKFKPRVRPTVDDLTEVQVTGNRPATGTPTPT